MKIENIIRSFAGTMVLVSVALTYFVSPWWLLFTTFIGLNLLQSGITGFCPPEILLRKLGVGKGEGCCGGDKSGKC